MKLEYCMLAGRRLAGLAEGIFVGLPALPLEDFKTVGREAENAARNDRDDAAWVAVALISPPRRA